MQRCGDKIRAHMISERPPEYLFRSSVDHGREEPEPAVHPQIRDVAIPNNVRPAGLKASLYKVRKQASLSSRNVVRMPGTRPETP
jgi:hypothetical protein